MNSAPKPRPTIATRTLPAITNLLEKHLPPLNALAVRVRLAAGGAFFHPMPQFVEIRNVWRRTLGNANRLRLLRRAGFLWRDRRTRFGADKLSPQFARRSAGLAWRPPVQPAGKVVQWNH